MQGQNIPAEPHATTAAGPSATIGISYRWTIINLSKVPQMPASITSSHQKHAQNIHHQNHTSFLSPSLGKSSNPSFPGGRCQSDGRTKSKNHITARSIINPNKHGIQCLRTSVFSNRTAFPFGHTEIPLHNHLNNPFTLCNANERKAKFSGY